MFFAAILLASVACEGSDWDRHALTGPESSRLIASVEINPTHAVIHPDGEKQFSAVVRSGRGTVVSRNVTWRSLDEDVLLVDPSGTVIGMNEGTATLEATHQGVKGQVMVDVYGEVVAIRLNRNSLTLDEGHTAQLEAVYVYANGAERPAGPLEWRSDDPTILRVDSDGLARGIRDGITMIRVRGRGHKLGVESRVRASAVASVEVMAPTTSLRVGDEVQFWAEIRDSEGNRLFRPLEWSSSNGSVASVSATGMVQAQASGEARIRARVDGVLGEVAIAVGSSSSGGQTEARPGAVTNLSVASTETNAVRLQFREVDDGTGQPAEYDVRYAVAPLGHGWGSAERVVKGSCQAPVRGTGIGNTRSCTVEGLQPGTKYDFQLVPFRGTMQQGAIYGSLSNITTGTTQAAPIQVSVRPSGATLDVEDELSLRATVTDLYGNTLNRTVSWSSTRASVATVSGSGNTGLVTALNPGDTDVRATTDGVHGTSRIRVVRPFNLTPNEPSGFHRIAEHNFSCIPGTGCALSGQWTERDGPGGNLRIVSASGAPVSPPSVIETRFPRGHRAGTGPVSFRGWSSLSARHEYRSIYFSQWIRIRGPDYENHPGITKLGWFGYAEGTIGNHGSLQGHTPNYTGNPQILRELTLRFVQQNNVGRAIWANTRMRVGEWYHWEVLMELNDVGRANGTFRWWQDGRLIASANDVVYRTPGAEDGFYSYHWNPTWGGAGDFTKTRDDYIEIDHIYISGVPK